MRLKSLLILKICRFLTKFSPENYTHEFLAKKNSYTFSLSLKNFILGESSLKNNEKKKIKKSSYFKKKSKKLNNFLFLSIQSQFNQTKANFFPVSLKKKILLNNFLEIKNISRLKNIKELSAFISFTKLNIIEKENHFVPLNIFKTKNNHSFVFKNKRKKKNQRKTNTYQKFDKLIDYVKPEKQPIVDLRSEIPL